MGKSYRKHDYIGHGGACSEKQDKREANRRLRHRVKQCLHSDPSKEVLPVLREVSDVWCFNKDGKGYFGDMLKTNCSRYPHVPRKGDTFWERAYRECKRK